MYGDTLVVVLLLLLIGNGGFKVHRETLVREDEKERGTVGVPWWLDENRDVLSKRKKS